MAGDYNDEEKEEPMLNWVKDNSSSGNKKDIGYISANKVGNGG